MIIQEEPKKVDITAIFLDLKSKYRNVFLFQFGDQVFFYRSLGRKEYRQILDDPDLNDLQKENVICELCTLYPKGFDWNDCDAGIPTELVKMILMNSFLDSIEARQRLLGYYRAEMYDLDNQITCMINEAFPNIDLEEIEEWDVEKTTKYLSRAEWKLHNLRGLQFVDGEGDYYEGLETQAEQQTQQQEVKRDTTPTETIRQSRQSGKTKLTPDEIKRRREAEEFMRKFPEFGAEKDPKYRVDVTQDDSVANYGIEGMAQDSVDDRSPALRTSAMVEPPKIDQDQLQKMREKFKK